MIDYDAVLSMQPYGTPQAEKERLYAQWMHELSEHHRAHCAPYARICKALGSNTPALPVRLFKTFDLRSVGEETVIKTMTSSGTTGQAVSRIFLDRETSARQSKALSKIVSDFTGKTRMPMLVIDSSAVLKDRSMFSARGAGILGFSMLGRDVTYALDADMRLDRKTVRDFLARHTGERIFLFGFTFMIWQYFVKPLQSMEEKLSIDGIMIHGGGWKKLQAEAIDNSAFSAAVREVCGVETTLNYYGMVEQTGSIFMECPYGHLHASVFSDIVIRDPSDFSELKTGCGLIETRSVLPTSYPGHILLTEDEGELLGEDDCLCGRKGRYFMVYGRVRGAEIRGCSDTYEQH